MTLQLGPVIGKVGGGAGFYGHLNSGWDAPDNQWHTLTWDDTSGDVLIPAGTYRIIGLLTSSSTYRKFTMRLGSAVGASVSNGLALALDATVTLTEPAAVQVRADGTSLNRHLDEALVAVVSTGG